MVIHDIMISYCLFKLSNNLQQMALYKLMIIVLTILMLLHDDAPWVINGVSISLCLGEVTGSLETTPI